MEKNSEIGAMNPRTEARTDKLRVVESTEEALAGSDQKDAPRELTAAGADCKPGTIGWALGSMVPDDHLASLALPCDYVMSSERIERQEEIETKGEPKIRITQVALAPIAVTARYEDRCGEAWLVLAWMEADGQWRRILLPRADALSRGRLLVAAGRGFPVSSGTAGPLVTYLEQFERRNFMLLVRGRVATQMGWQGTREFLWGLTALTWNARRPALADLSVATEQRDHLLVQPEGPGELQLMTAFHAAGSMECWREAVSVLKDFPRAQIAFYASFVPPLLEILEEHGFVVALAHRTSTGKTTALRAAASVWGRPDEERPDSVIRTWDTTTIGVERIVATLSGLPLLLDDTQRVKKPEDITNIIYLVCQGMGRMRGRFVGTQAMRNFRTVLISTGESPATSASQAGGARMRTLDVRGMPFDRVNEENAKITTQLNAQVRRHYGHAGPAFVQMLLRWHRGWEGMKRQFQVRRDRLAARCGNAQADRLAAYGAAIDLAAVLAHRFLRLPWQLVPPCELLWDDLVGHAADAAGAKRALLDVVSWSQSRESAFWGRHATRADGAASIPPGGLIGRWDLDKPNQSWEYVAFYPTRLRAQLQSMGYQPDAILAEWRERGWLKVDAGNMTTKVHIHGENRRVVVILRGAIEEVGA